MDKLIDAMKEKFLAELALSGNVSHSGRQVGCCPSDIRDRRKSDPAFDLACQEAMAEYKDKIQYEAYRRAVHGVTREVRYQGEVVGTEQVYSDRLLELELKAKVPEKYKDKKEITGAGGGAVQINIVDFSDTDDG